MLLFETTWMDFEGTVLSEINQAKTNTVGCHLYAEPEKKKKNSEKQRTDWRLPEVGGEGNGESGQKKQTPSS